MRFLLSFLLVISLFSLPFPIHAEDNWVPPQPPFSVEGNPPMKYFFGPIFNLHKYIKPQNLQVYENRDRSRQYEHLWVCGGDNDLRDYECTWEDPSCDGGDVGLCRFNTSNPVVRWAYSSPNSSCTAKPPSDKFPNGRPGKCSYRQLPKISNKYAGTDFSNAQDLVFPKIQSEAFYYSSVGDETNPITYGAMQLSLSLEEKILRQLVVVRRAKQTKATVHETGEWPLGWVDWGYKTPNGKTLVEINDELPDSIANPLINVVEGLDDYYLNAGNLEAVSGIAEDQAEINLVLKSSLSESPLPEWLTDVMQSPMYSPSWRMGYVRPSICVWKICCPGFRCQVPPPIGIKRGLYFDNSISQAFGAALDDLMIRNTLTEGVRQFKKIAVKNPLVRFATSAAPNATTTKINERLMEEVAAEDPCFQYRAGFGSFLAFGTHMDYVLPGDFFDKEQKCPDYQIMPELDKQNAAAFSNKGIFALIAMKWGQQQDDVDPIKYHILTIPDVMGQSIQDIKQPRYDSRDTLAELEGINEFNLGLSNTVDDQKDYLYAGKFPFDPRRLISGYYPCDNEMYSTQRETSIEAYALGERNGCFGETNSPTSGLCTGEAFAKIITDSPWKEPLPSATQVILNSAMFKDGKLNPELESVYAEVEKKTGVPCEVLAGLHFEEASSCFTDFGNPEKCSNANGGPVNEQGGFATTSETAAKALLRHPIPNTERLITALSNFNGGGNSNCQQGLGVNVPYNNCPRKFIGEDDPYVTHMLDSQHDNMYQIYCGDFKVCNPLVPYDQDRPGAFAVALAVYNNATSKNATNSPTTSSQPKPTTPSTPTQNPSTSSIVNPSGDCGTGYINTGLGCLPYEQTEFVMALLRFIVGISGGLALILMLSGVVRIMTANGDSKQIQSGRDLFFAAVSGLLFLIFSVSLARIFGANIFKIPGF